MKNKIILSAFVLIILNTLLFSQVERPKLVVGIVVDQMRFTDLYKYYDYYSDKGFRKLINEGTNFTFAHFNYELTSTGPGHASIYTGTTPYYHGITSNDFYDRKTNRIINCVQDDEQSAVGNDSPNGKKSPQNLLATTITDQLKLYTNKKAKVISISIKDRGAILPAGHLADAAFWFDTRTGNFISSTYYMKELPEWLKNFNNKKFPDQYLSKEWNLLLNSEAYKILPSDDSQYEKDEFNEGKTYFPHYFDKIEPSRKYEKFQFTPFANQILVELTKEAIINEKVGENTFTDFLAISFSATDIIAHSYGNYSYELMDTYIRLDRQIAELLSFLDQKIGRNNYLLFLTSDHAAIETPGYLRDNNIPTGGLGTDKVLDSLKQFSVRTFGSSEIIQNFSNRQILLNREFIKNNSLDFISVERKFVEYLRNNFYEIQNIFTRTFFETQIAQRTPINSVLNGWNPIMSGDIIFSLKPGFLNNFLEKGTTHSSSYSYDTHAPLIFYGWKIPSATINNPVYIVDIAPTIANLLKISLPNSSIGIPIIKVDQ